MKKIQFPPKKIQLQAVKNGMHPTINKCCGSDHPTAVAPNKKLDDLTTKLSEAIWNKKETIGIEGQITVEESLHLIKGLKSGYGVTVGYNTPDTLAYQMMEYNLFEFSATKTEARLAAMTDLLIDKEKNEIRSYAAFEELASQKVASFNKEWLQTEYNLSVAVGQNSAAYVRFKAQKDDFPYVEYQTIGDKSVRTEHEKLNGLIFSLDDTEAMKLWPPNGYNCRCEMLQTIGKPTKTTSGKVAQEIINSEDAKWSDGQFNINRGDLNKVFTNQQFYSDKKGLPKKLNDMTYDKYDLPSYADLKGKLNPMVLDKSITPKNAFELFEKTGNNGKDDFMGFKDYFNRKLILAKPNFDQHTSGKNVSDKEKRHQLFPFVKDALNEPDEVWVNLGKGIQTSYVKHYNNRSLLVVTSFDKPDGLKIETWFEIDYEGQLEKRKGLLIKKGKNL